MNNKAVPAKIQNEIDEVTEILSREAMINTLIEDAKKKAIELIQSGYEVPGYYLKPRSTHAKWKGDVTASALHTIFSDFVLDEDAFKKLKTPAEVKKYFAENPKACEKWQTLIEYKSLGMGLGKEEK